MCSDAAVVGTASVYRLESSSSKQTQWASYVINANESLAIP